MEAARSVKDVSPHDFVKAYAAHLKRSGKVYTNWISFYIHICFDFLNWFTSYIIEYSNRNNAEFVAICWIERFSNFNFVYTLPAKI